MLNVSWLESDKIWFPHTRHALHEPNGLLAVGGDLRDARLIYAYSKGIFPWYSDDQPILWWTPDPRMVLFPNELHIGRSLRKLLRKHVFYVTVDQCFRDVIDACAKIERNGEVSTWITDELKDAYCHLHELGVAHSIEAWQEDRLVGGLYGVSLGKVFFGESMFSAVSGASKVAFATLAMQLIQWEFSMIDCQIHTDYLSSFGAREIPRTEFEQHLRQGIPSAELKHWSEATLSERSERPPKTNFWPDKWSMTEYGLD